MFDWFKSGGKGAAKPSLDAVRFNDAEFDFQGEPQPGKVRFWHTPDGDGMGVYFFRLPPDLPQNAVSLEVFSAFYRERLGGSGGVLVELGIVEVGGVPAVRTLASLPQQPSGRTYVGSLTIPFRDFSFVVKCQCPELGHTGMKAALLLDRSLAAAESNSEPAEAHLAKLDLDHPKHDADFPDEPVARARRVMDHLAASLVIDSEIRRLPGFALPR